MASSDRRSLNGAPTRVFVLATMLALAGVSLGQDDEQLTDEPAARAPSEAPVTEAAPVAEGESADSTDGQTPESPSPLSRLEAQLELGRSLSAQDYATAEQMAQRLLEISEQESGPNSRDAAEAHNTLAEAQRQAGEHGAAEASYLKAIDIFRDIDGPFGASLIKPTVGLGDNYYDDAQYVNAVSAYSEARSIQRRVFGVLSEEQIELLDRMTASFQRMGMPTEADEQQQNALIIVERNHGESSVEVLEAIYRYAGWLRSVGRFLDERVQYERAIRIIREAYGKESPLLARPYREIGNSFRASGFQQSRGASALQTALELVEQQSPTDPLALAEVLLDVGDWNTAFGTVDGGAEEYLRAWQALSAVERGAEYREAWFGGRRPVFVLTDRMSDRGLSSGPDAEPGSVIVQFDIDARGRSENVVVVESSPPGFKDEAAARAIRQSRFRPKIVDGELTGARNMGVEITFRYSPLVIEETDNSG